MQQPEHDLRPFQAPVASPRRFVSVGLVAALHVAIIYALASGLAARMVQKLPSEFKAEVVQQKPPQQEKTPPPPPPDLAKPPPPFVPPPDFTIQSTGPTTAISQVQSKRPVAAITRPTTRGRPHSCYSGYPPISKRLGEQGVVTVKFTVGVNGDVSNVSVAKSSGYSRLDQAAVRCAQRWEYHPATQGGRPIAISYEAKVLYHLQ